MTEPIQIHISGPGDQSERLLQVDSWGSEVSVCSYCGPLGRE